MRMDVPNAPCGVESVLSKPKLLKTLSVPNAPCGVERLYHLLAIFILALFLMHRVELKDVR